MTGEGRGRATVGHLGHRAPRCSSCGCSAAAWARRCSGAHAGPCTCAPRLCESVAFVVQALQRLARCNAVQWRGPALAARGSVSGRPLRTISTTVERLSPRRVGLVGQSAGDMHRRCVAVPRPSRTPHAEAGELGPRALRLVALATRPRCAGCVRRAPPWCHTATELVAALSARPSTLRPSPHSASNRPDFY